MLYIPDSGGSSSQAAGRNPGARVYADPQHSSHLLIIKVVSFLNVAVIAKSNISSGTYLNLKSIAYNSTTRQYTLTRSDDTTVTYSSDTYYLVMLWS